MQLLSEESGMSAILWQPANMALMMTKMTKEKTLSEVRLWWRQKTIRVALHEITVRFH